MGLTPIHNVSEDCNRRIKEFYWKLWFSNETPMPEIDVHEIFIGPEVARFISGQVETFCDVVGNQNEAYKLAQTTKVKAPMEFAIVTGWQVNKPL